MYCTADCITQVRIAGHITELVWNQFSYKGFVREKSCTVRFFSMISTCFGVIEQNGHHLDMLQWLRISSSLSEMVSIGDHKYQLQVYTICTAELTDTIHVP